MKEMMGQPLQQYSSSEKKNAISILLCPFRWIVNIKKTFAFNLTRGSKNSSVSPSLAPEKNRPSTVISSSSITSPSWYHQSTRPSIIVSKNQIPSVTPTVQINKQPVTSSVSHAFNYIEENKLSPPSTNPNKSLIGVGLSLLVPTTITLKQSAHEFKIVSLTPSDAPTSSSSPQLVDPFNIKKEQIPFIYGLGILIGGILILLGINAYVGSWSKRKKNDIQEFCTYEKWMERSATNIALFRNDDINEESWMKSKRSLNSSHSVSDERDNSIFTNEKSQKVDENVCVTELDFHSLMSASTISELSGYETSEYHKSFQQNKAFEDAWDDYI